MEESEKKVFTEKDMNNLVIVFYMLLFANIIYLFLLLILDMSATDLSGNSSSLTDLLFYILIIVAIVDIALAFKVLLPRALLSDNPYTSFPAFLIPIVLCESPGIFGLLIGLLQLYSELIHVNWVEVLGFFLISIASIYWMIENQIKPHLRKFVGMEVKYPVTRTR